MENIVNSVSTRVNGIANGTSSVTNVLKEFVIQNNLLSTSLAVTLGFSTQDFIKAFIADIIMPLLNPLFGTVGVDDWKTKEVTIGKFTFKVGHFLSIFIYYSIILTIIYIIIKFFNK